MLPGLTTEELLRYSRHLILPEVGETGQRKLKAARVLLVGTGGLGSPAALYLAAAGVGQMGLVDFDEVDITNLHRQVIHGTPDLGRHKLDSAEESILAINPNVRVVKHAVRLSRENALEVLGEYDLVVDGTDNFPTRYLVNDACVLLRKPNVYGSIFRFEGQATVFCVPGGPCYRCLYPEPPPPGMVPSCAEAGVLGVLPGIIGVIQATEAIKLILEVGEPLIGRLLLYDALGMKFNEVRIRRDPQCPICGDAPTQTGLIDYEGFCGLRPTGASERPIAEIDSSELARLLAHRESLSLIDVREPDEYESGHISGGRLIPLGQVASRMGEFERSKRTVVYCRSGIRSAKACAILMEAGFKNVENLRGGILDWMKQGGPTE